MGPSSPRSYSRLSAVCSLPGGNSGGRSHAQKSPWLPRQVERSLEPFRGPGGSTCPGPAFRSGRWDQPAPRSADSPGSLAAPSGSSRCGWLRPVPRRRRPNTGPGRPPRTPFVPARSPSRTLPGFLGPWSVCPTTVPASREGKRCLSLGTSVPRIVPGRVGGGGRVCVRSSGVASGRAGPWGAPLLALARRLVVPHTPPMAGPSDAPEWHTQGAKLARGSEGRRKGRRGPGCSRLPVDCRTRRDRKLPFTCVFVQQGCERCSGIKGPNPAPPLQSSLSVSRVPVRAGGHASFPDQPYPT